MGKSILTFLILITSHHLLSQRNFIEESIPEINVVKAEEKIKLDGVLDESVWSQCISGSNFSQFFPTDTTNALGETEMLFAADDENLYLAVICHSTGSAFQVPTLKRDYGFRNSDNFSIIFDTFGDQTNGVLFGINAFGSIREATIANGGRNRSDFDNSWDNKWYGNSKIYDDKWIGEMTIPFKALRFKDDNLIWRICAYRYDAQTNEISSWIALPRNRVLMDMSYMGHLVWDEAPKTSGRNIALIPYVISTTTRDFEDLNESKPQNAFNVGGDVKVGITTGLNLDLTVNPDFSQVEVDRQVTNLDRFEIFFPERRQFFLENADLFGNFGEQTLNPFFSRRIGIALDTTTGVNIQNPVHYGARLSGKLTNKLRIGLLNMQTASDDDNGLPVFNYSILAMEHRVGMKSSVALIAQNKVGLNTDGFNGDYDPFNRLVGGEFRYFSNNDKWFGKATLLNSISASETEQNISAFFRLGYNVRKWFLRWEQSYIGKGFDAELGFVPRKDIMKISPLATYRMFPESGQISNHDISISLDQFYKLGNEEESIISEFTPVDAQMRIQHSMGFVSGARLSYSMNYADIFLLNDFDPTRIQEEDVFLPAGTDYQYWSFGANYRNDNRKNVNFNVSTNLGQFFNGTRMNIGGDIRYRFRPYGSIGVGVNYNRLDLAAPFTSADLWLISPMLDVTLSKKLFITSFFQYNQQSENLNINTRIQWRFQPASDIFLVYTDNYLTDSFSQFEKRNRAFVIKANYWLSL